MATLASIATGNFTTAGTWALCNSTSENDSVSANTTVTTSYVASTAFTPGAITIDGIGIKVATRSGSTGTISIELYNSTAGASVAGTEITFNVSDIAACSSAANGGGGWYFTKFAGVLLLAATNYQVRVKTSSASQVNLFSSATTNWSRQLRTTTTQAPAVSDKLFIQGDWTAAATSSTYDVTMNETATTAYGNIAISNKGSLAYGTSASTSYYLKCQTLDVYSGATFSIGTTGSTMPSTSSAVLEFNSASAGQYQLHIRSGATVIMQGNPKTSIMSLMTADIAAAGTSLTVVDTTGWAANDVLAIPTTTRTITQCESKTISTVNSATNVTIAAITNAHSGTSPTQAMVGNLTRNVKVRGISAANTGYMKVWPTTATIDIDYVEFSSMGTGSIAAIQCESVGGTQSIRYSSIHDCTVSSTNAMNLTSISSGTGIEFSNNIIYNVAQRGIQISGVNSGYSTFDNNLIIYPTTSDGFYSADNGVVCTNNTIAGAGGHGFTLLGETSASIGTFNGNTAYGNTTDGFRMINFPNGTISTLTAWRNGQYGLNILFSGSTNYGDTIYDTGSYFGNVTANITIGGNIHGSLLFKSITLNAGTTLICPIGLQLSNGNTAADGLFFESCSFGATTTHSTGDISMESIFSGQAQFYNTMFGSSTEISSQTNAPNIGYIYKGICSTKHDTTAVNIKNWSKFGTISTDTTFYNTVSPSVRQTPNNASNKLLGCFKVIPVISGGTVTVSVYVRCSVVGDGTAYNGARPRVMVRKNLELGITSDTVIDTATVSSDGAFELLTGTTASASADGAFEFYVDCDGTTGWINVDDFTTTSTTDSSGMKYWIYGSPAIDGPTPGSSSSSGGSWTF